MIAQDLDQAYTNFDPARPLPGVSEFYVKRQRNPLDRMKRALLRENLIAPKFLFSGHRGSGKSSELSRLMAYPEMKEKYFIVHYSVREVLDPAGLDYTDLLLSIGAQIFIKATDVGKLSLKEGLLKELEKWIGAIDFQESTEDKVGSEIGIDLKILQAKLKTGYTSRIEIRKTIEARLPQFISITNLIIAEVEIKTGKKVLVAIDDLDKPNLEVSKKIFCESQASLTLPNCSIIYTIPIALHYCPEAGQVIPAFTGSYVLPNVTITNHEDGSQDEEGEGYATMRKFVEKRMSLNLIEDGAEEGALNYAISISGGVFREIARIMSMAADNAVARGGERIEKKDVEEAGSEIRNEFRRMLRTEDYGILNTIHETRNLRGLETCDELLHNLSIMEYQNNENWCDVHPVIVPLIEGNKS